MKILYISDSAIPSYSANSIHVMKMCQAWTQLGHDVTLVGKLTQATLRNVPDVFAFYGIDNHFGLEIFPHWSFPGSGRLYNLLLPLKLRRKIDLLYTRSIYAAFWCALLGIDFAFEVHEPYDTKNGWLRFMFKKVASSSNLRRMVAISEALKNDLVAKGLRAGDDVIVAHDGADPINGLQGDKPAIRNRGRLNVGYAGSLLKGKAMEIVVPLSKVCPAIDFHILGGRPEEIAAAQAQLSTDNVVFYGNVAHGLVPLYLLQFDILLAPYMKGVFVKSDKSGNNIAMWMSPLKIFEYMSSGKPIVSSDLPVLREILHDGENARLCNPDDVHSWKKALEELSANPGLRSRLGVRAKEEFLAVYTWKSRAENILKSIVVR